jgi:hypothetical protein
MPKRTPPNDFIVIAIFTLLTVMVYGPLVYFGVQRIQRRKPWGLPPAVPIPLNTSIEKRTFVRFLTIRL